jgi:capsular polysaccharide export protein
MVLWSDAAGAAGAEVTLTVHGDCDPWHMMNGAAALIVSVPDEVCVIARLLGVPVYVFDALTGGLTEFRGDAEKIVAEVLGSGLLENPFTGDPMTCREAIELCSMWRHLIDSNRSIAAGFGFAFWKRDQVSPLLWGGAEPISFLAEAELVMPKARIAVWRSKTAPRVLAALEKRGANLIEVEDGFLRSSGLGALCVPPLSITVDNQGAYFDPTAPSDLETLLEDEEFDEALLARARKLRRAIIAAGLGKYEAGTAAAYGRPAGNRRVILVPGQVEDDRSVQTGGCGISSNLDLLARVRADAGDAYILYKPHPDVVAGHRKGAVRIRECLQYADEIISDVPVSTLIAAADEVHVNTSLTGFEALLREKPVTTHGVPFYAGWGLTRDLGPVPPRRTSRRTLDELAAATLLIYPRYLDPVTGLPCPAEIVVDRLVNGAASGTNILVSMRRLQGKLMRGLRNLVA